MGFKFSGTSDVVRPNEYIQYTLATMEKVKIFFTPQGDDTNLAKSFEAKSENSLELQRDGWQAIPNNSKKYAKAKGM